MAFICFSCLVELAKCPVHSAGFSVDSQRPLCSLQGGSLGDSPY